MALTLLKLISGDPQGNGNIEDYNFDTVTVDGDKETALRHEIAQWIFKEETKETTDYDDYGPYEDFSVKESPLTEFIEDCFIYRGRLTGLRRYGSLFFLNGNSVANTPKGSSHWSSPRIYSSISVKYSIYRREVEVSLYGELLYRIREGNPYYLLVSAPKTITHAELHPDTKEIADSVFDGCEKLTSVSIPEGVQTIGYNAFRNCVKLTSIALPSTVTKIGTSAFEYCTELLSIQLPCQITYISDGTFRYCRNLQSITIPNTVKKIYSEAFNECMSLVSVEIPESVTEIDRHAFKMCSTLTNVTLPSSLTQIGEDAFCCCFKLTSLRFKNIHGWSTVITYPHKETPIPPEELADPENALKFYKKREETTWVRKD